MAQWVHRLALCSYTLVFQDQHTLPKRNILSNLLLWLVWIYKQREQATITALRQNISLWEGVLVIDLPVRFTSSTAALDASLPVPPVGLVPAENTSRQCSSDIVDMANKKTFF